MTAEHITVTEAARNFADCVNRAYYRNESFVLTRNGVPVARLVPAGPETCTGRDLAAVFGNLILGDDEAAAWKSDLKNARKALKKPAEKWK